MAIEDYFQIGNMLYGIGRTAFEELSKSFYSQEEFLQKEEEEIIREKNINVDYCVDFKDDRYMCGVKYVYGWRNENGELIYIGQGELRRTIATAKTSRNSGFSEHTGGKLYLYYFAKRASKTAAVEIEKMLIQRCCLKGIRLENVREVLSEQSVKYFRGRLNGLQMWESKAQEELYQNYCMLEEEHEEVAKKFDRFLSDIKPRTRRKRIQDAQSFVKPDRNKDRRTYWTIDGVTKPAMEWCKEYGRSISNVIYRTENMGISLKQALTFPSVRYTKEKGGALQQWKEMGLL